MVLKVSHVNTTYDDIDYSEINNKLFPNPNMLKPDVNPYSDINYATGNNYNNQVLNRYSPFENIVDVNTLAILVKLIN